ncbi:hypothetical protein [uncultured Psychroserpens sp.]|uniref:Spy/CpxP family protein refolding chaperone n=1 Tax=uncultured Psychroserpens sp. TaxID=255436 RepID=UPI00260EA16B|nr:hypothetical protein [uncultured Psychroserpens sp.]
MKNNKILYILIGFLIVVNLFFLFNYLGHTNGKKKEHKRDFITKELKFDNDQMERFKVLRDQHYLEVRTLSDSIGNVKEVLYKHISEAPISKPDVDSIIAVIGNLEEKKDVERFYYFKAIHDICNDDQKVRFKALIKNAIHKKREKSYKSKR